VVGDGEILLASIEDDAVPVFSRAVFHDSVALLAPVEVSGRVLRVNISLGEELLAWMDGVSKL